jgi:hypothetical protein
MDRRGGLGRSTLRRPFAISGGDEDECFGTYNAALADRLTRRTNGYGPDRNVLRALQCQKLCDCDECNTAIDRHEDYVEVEMQPRHSGEPARMLL